MDTQTLFAHRHMRALAAVVGMAIVALLIVQIVMGAISIRDSERYNYLTVINVEGSGEVSVKPDIAQFSFTVRSKDSDSMAASQQATEKTMSELTSYLSDEGVDEADIKTTYFDAGPIYDYRPSDKCIDPYGYCDYEEVLEGYETYQSVSVKVRDVDSASSLIGGVAERGATDVSSLSFTIDDTSAYEEEARGKAIADAQKNAEVLAEQLGVKLGDVSGFYEYGSDPYDPYYPEYGAYADSAYGISESRSLSSGLPTGENTVTVDVTLTYQIR